MAYSILATSIFYFLSQYIPVYLPRQQRKIKILSNAHQKALIIDNIISELKLSLNIGDNSDFTDKEKFRLTLITTNPNEEIGGFENWHHYFFNLKANLLDVIRSLTFYNDYLSKEFLHELIILEKVLLAYKTIRLSNLSYAEITIQELLIHNKILQELRIEESMKYEKEFVEEGKRYRKANYND